MAQTATQPAQTSQTIQTQFQIAVVAAHLALVADNDAKQSPRISEEDAIQMIATANRPVIIITKDSAHTYAGMMGYMAKAFPNIPIIVEQGGHIHDATICDVYRAAHVYKGYTGTHIADSFIKRADTAIIMGDNPHAVAQNFTSPHQTVLSKNTTGDIINMGDGRHIGGGVNIAAAANSPAIKDKASSWAAWNTKPVMGRCPV